MTIRSKTWLGLVLNKVTAHMPHSYPNFKEFFDNLCDSIPYLSEDNTLTGTTTVPNGTVATPSIESTAGNSGIYFGSGTAYFSTAGSHYAGLTGDGSFTVNTGSTTGGYKTSVANTQLGVFYNAAKETIVAGTGGAISKACYYTDIAVDADGDAFTLAAGNAVGQVKKIMMSATAGGTGVVTSTFRGANTTLTFTNAGEFAVLIWDGTDWLDIELASVVTLTHAPVLA